jgi:hypothetical protein
MGVPAIGTGIQGNHVFDNGADVPIFDNDICFLVHGCGVFSVQFHLPDEEVVEGVRVRAID